MLEEIETLKTGVLQLQQQAEDMFLKTSDKEITMFPHTLKTFLCSMNTAYVELLECQREWRDLTAKRIKVTP